MKANKNFLKYSRALLLTNIIISANRAEEKVVKIESEIDTLTNSPSIEP